LAAGTILFVGGAITLGTTLLLASGNEQAKPAFPPPREKLARPDESHAMPVESARTELQKNADLAAVIDAAESGDIDALMSLAVSAGDDYCSRLRNLPSECKSRDDKIPTVYQDSGEIGPRPVETMRVWLSNLYRGASATLEFASRDSRFREGNGGKYYLVFRFPAAFRFDDGLVIDALGLVVIPGSEHPIQWFAFGEPEGNGLKWVQVVGGNDGAKYQILIAPESVKDWPDIEGQKAD